MIKIIPKPEPADFDDLVRIPGNAFLNARADKSKAPTNKEFEGKTFWREIIPELEVLYDRICAYCCEFIPHVTGGSSVEHFWPKSKQPYSEAYEWRNYRLVCTRVNGWKGVKTDVLDPFKIENGWFVIDFATLLVKAADATSLPVTVTVKQIEDTITTLKLNHNDRCFKSRKAHLEEYCRSGNIAAFRAFAPFLAKEVTRQGYSIADLIKIWPVAPYADYVDE